MNLSRDVCAILVGAVLGPAPLSSQYPLAPSPALDLARLSARPRLTRYVALRGAVRADTSTVSVARARLGVEAQPLAVAALRVQADFTATGRTAARTEASLAMSDAYVQLSPPESSSHYRRFRPALLLGQFKTPLSLDYLTSFSTLRTVNRSQATDRLAPRRDIGVMARAQGWGDRVLLAAAVLNGEGPNRFTGTDRPELIVGRVTLAPLPGTLAAAGKLAARGADHWWGGDVRVLTRLRPVPGSIVVEGELIRRVVRADGASADAGGGYALVAWGVLPWLEPVAKWERLGETRTTSAATSERSLTWVTYGVTLRSAEPRERLRVQVNWITKVERPVDAENELLAQLILRF